MLVAKEDWKVTQDKRTRLRKLDFQYWSLIGWENHPMTKLYAKVGYPGAAERIAKMVENKQTYGGEC